MHDGKIDIDWSIPWSDARHFPNLIESSGSSEWYVGLPPYPRNGISDTEYIGDSFRLRRSKIYGQIRIIFEQVQLDDVGLLLLDNNNLLLISLCELYSALCKT